MGFFYLSLGDIAISLTAMPKALQKSKHGRKAGLSERDSVTRADLDSGFSPREASDKHSWPHHKSARHSAPSRAEYAGIKC